MVDADAQVLEFVGHTAPLLAFVPGPASLDVRRIVRHDLAGALTDALEKARSAGNTVRTPGTDLQIYTRPVRVTFEISPRQKGPGTWMIAARCQHRPPRQAEQRLLSEVTTRMGRIQHLREEFRQLRDEAHDRQNALVAEMEDVLLGVREVQEALEISNTELETANVQLTASIAEREAMQERLIRSEAAAREILETASQAIIAVTASGKIVQANQLAHTMFGYRDGDLAGRKLGALVPRGNRKDHRRHVAGFVESPERRAMGDGRDLWGVRKDGERFPVEVGLSSIVGEDGRLAVAFITDITKRKHAEQQIQADHERLRDLTNRLVTAGEDEARKWAREIHDVYSQRLVAIAMELDRLAGSPDQAKVYALRALESDVRRLADDIHGMARRMHPAILDDIGLVAALRSELNAFGKRHGLTTALHATGVDAHPRKDVALCCYRIVQEALTNIRKHARARSVRVDLTESDGTLILAIRDDGRGFNTKAFPGNGLGLLSIRERAQAVGGSVSVESGPKKGTMVKVRFPKGAR